MNQESLNNTGNVNNNVAPQPVQPTYTVPAQPTTAAPQPVQSQAVPAQPAYTAQPVQSQAAPAQPASTAQPVQPQVVPAQPTYTAPQPVQPQPTVENNESIEKVANLNKEDAMEEALSHTNQYTPFEVQQEEVNQEVSFMSNKKALIFLGFVLGIMLLFIIFLPQISDFITNIING